MAILDISGALFSINSALRNYNPASFDLNEAGDEYKYTEAEAISLKLWREEYGTRPTLVAMEAADAALIDGRCVECATPKKINTTASASGMSVSHGLDSDKIMGFDVLIYWVEENAWIEPANAYFSYTAEEKMGGIVLKSLHNDLIAENAPIKITIRHNK